MIERAVRILDGIRLSLIVHLRGNLLDRRPHIRFCFIINLKQLAVVDIANFEFSVGFLDFA